MNYVTAAASPPESCQDLVIGSGAGGATTALMLATAGRAVAVLEEGAAIESKDFSGRIDSLMGRLYRDNGLTPIMGRPTIAFAEGRCLGGSTVINGALMWRAPETVIDRWRLKYTLPDLTSASLEPHFEQLETELSVGTQPDRSANRQSWLLERGANSLGWQSRLTPRAQSSCKNSNRCPTGCPSGAKQSMLVSFIPRASEKGAAFHCGYRADKIVFNGRRAHGVEVVSSDDANKRAVIRAERIFVCGGPMQSPYLLRRSGIRSHVGDSLGLHLNLKIVAEFSEEVDPGNGTIMASQVSEFSERGLYIGGSTFDPVYLALTMAIQGEKYVSQVMQNWKSTAIFVAQLRATGSGRVGKLPFFDRPFPSYRVTAQDLVEIRFSLLRAAEVLFAAGAKRLFLPVIDSGPITGMTDCQHVCEHLTDGRKLDLLSVHAMGSVPMGLALRDGGRVIGTDNVYVNDASMLPDATGTNPQLTIMAMAMRNMSMLLDG